MQYTNVILLVYLGVYDQPWIFREIIWIYTRYNMRFKNVPDFDKSNWNYGARPHMFFFFRPISGSPVSEPGRFSGNFHTICGTSHTETSTNIMELPGARLSRGVLGHFRIQYWFVRCIVGSRGVSRSPGSPGLVIYTQIHQKYDVRVLHTRGGAVRCMYVLYV